MNSTSSAPPRLSVLKFGSSVLHDPDDFLSAVHEIYRHIRKGEKVVAVVSAMAGETDQLFGFAETLKSSDAEPLTARLVRCGELKAAALLGLALARSGIPGQVMDPHEAGLTSDGPALDAEITGLDRSRIRSRLDAVDVVVIPGFFGDGPDGPLTFGRGGTDLTAVEIAIRLGADQLRLIKDVDGVYSADPVTSAQARRLDHVSYTTAIRISQGLIQEKAIVRAAEVGLPIEVAALGRSYGSLISHDAEPISQTGPLAAGRQLRVTLLGHGSVGAGVARHLLAHSDLFDLGPVLVRAPDVHRRKAPQLAFTDSPHNAFLHNPDVVIDTMGAAELATDIMARALGEGRHVVSADKAALEACGERLHKIADASGARLLYGAAVGGGVPMIERVAAAIPDGLEHIEAVLNGTCNFVLDALGQGCAFEPAVEAARQAGLAEADPSADLNGMDAARKLAILARHGFGQTIDLADIPCEPLDARIINAIDRARLSGQVVRQIGRLERRSDGELEARIELRSLPRDHSFARLKGAENAIQIVTKSGSSEYRGAGAGRWPTAEAVFADVMDIQRHHSPARRCSEPLVDAAIHPLPSPGYASAIGLRP
ncbi:homoserine dehydrogenase [Maricaulis sp. CAU 1757]